MTLSLFSRELKVVVLASGSKGNCTYIGDGLAGVLIDCGVSTRQIQSRLEAADMKDAPIDAVLITHEHSDHVGAAKVLCERLRHRRVPGRMAEPVAFWMSPGTRRGLRPQVTPSAVETVKPGEQFTVRHLVVDPFPVPHDTLEPIGYRVRSGGVWAGVMTDMGKPTTLVERKLRSLSVAVLEFNHDIEMLLGGRYPWPLKQRIRSSHGHLSNDQAAELLSAALPGSRMQHLVLAHLSEENNTPRHALARAARVLNDHGAGAEIDVQVAMQRQNLAPIRVSVSDW